jgi:hypothetical protein
MYSYHNVHLREINHNQEQLTMSTKNFLGVPLGKECVKDIHIHLNVMITNEECILCFLHFLGFLHFLFFRFGLLILILRG